MNNESDAGDRGATSGGLERSGYSPTKCIRPKVGEDGKAQFFRVWKDAEGKEEPRRVEGEEELQLAAQFLRKTLEDWLSGNAAVLALIPDSQLEIEGDFGGRKIGIQITLGDYEEERVEPSNIIPVSPAAAKQLGLS